MAKMHIDIPQSVIHAVGLGLYSVCRADQVMYGMVFKLRR